MRFIALITLCVSSAFAGGQPGVAIIYHFENEHSAESFDEMQGELATLLQEPGVEVSWYQRTAESFPATSESIVVLKFQGHCTMEGLSPRPPIPGALAVTYVVNGEILPFSDVDCERIRTNVRAAGAYDPKHAEFLLGRALGRVVAHELLHMLSKSNVHGRRGVMRGWLSGDELIGNRLSLAHEDAVRVISKRHEIPRAEQQVHGGG